MPKNQAERIIDKRRASSSVLIVAGGSTGGGGVTDHGALTGLGDDDHTQYLNTTRGDARYVPLTREVTAGNGLSGGGTLTGNVTLSLASTAAGDGLTYTTGVLAVGAGNGLTVAADSVALTTPGTLTVATTNSASGSHTHGIASSSNPGAAASILATDSSGVLRLVKFEVGTQAASPPAMTLWGTNSISTNPDIEFDTNALLAAANSMYFAIDTGDTSTSQTFRWLMDARTSSGDELMRLSEAGLLTVTGTGVRAAQIDTASGALTLAPVTDVTLTPGSNLVKLSASVNLQSANYASQTTGLRLTYSGQGDFRYIYTDELHAKAFIADLEQALAGGQIITKSVTTLAAAFTVPGYGVARTLTVNDLPSAIGMAVFESGDCVALRAFSRAGGGLTIGWAYGTVTAYSDNTDGTQSWTWTRLALANNAGGTLAATTVINAESIVLDFGTTGNGYHEINAIDGTYGANSPYAQIVTWSNTSPGYSNAQTVRTRTGNLNGLFAAGAEYGFYAGDGVAVTNSYIRISDRTFELHNTPLKLYDSGSVQRVNIDSTGTDVWFKDSGGNTKLSWNGSTLAIDGSGTFSGSITASSGTIAGWSITASEIKNSTGYLHMVSGGAGIARIEVGDQTTAGRGAGIVSRSTAAGIVFWAGEPYDSDLSTAPFTVTSAGALTATNATLTGSFTAGNVAINSGAAIKITATGTSAEDRSINWYVSTTRIGYIGIYGSAGAGTTIISSAGLNLDVTTISSAATTVDFGDAAMEVLRIKAATATGYLRSSADGNILSWSASGVGVTGTLTVSSTLSSDAITAPSIKASSGTFYIGVGATNYVSVSSAKFDATSTQFGGDWSTNILLAGDTTVGDWVSGYSGRIKKIGDVYWIQGRFDPVNSTSTGVFTRIGTISDSAYRPARDIAYPCTGYRYASVSDNSYDLCRCHIYTSGEIWLSAPGIWRDYQWIDITFGGSFA